MTRPRSTELVMILEDFGCSSVAIARENAELRPPLPLP